MRVLCRLFGHRSCDGCGYRNAHHCLRCNEHLEAAPAVVAHEHRVITLDGSKVDTSDCLVCKP